MKFKCLLCGTTELEEIMVDIIQTTPILDIDAELNEPVYGNASTEGGIVERYQCAQCGYILCDKNDKECNTTEDLLEWLDDHKEE